MSDAMFDLYVNGFGVNQPPVEIARAWAEVSASFAGAQWVRSADAAAIAVLVGRFPWCLAEAGRAVLAAPEEVAAQRWAVVAGLVPDEWKAAPYTLAAAAFRGCGQDRRARRCAFQARESTRHDPRCYSEEVGPWEQVADTLQWFAVDGLTPGQCRDALSPFRTPVAGGL